MYQGNSMATLRYRTLFLSDTHLGLRAARTEYLLDFLKHTESDTLYLVGDIYQFLLQARHLRGGGHLRCLEDEERLALADHQQRDHPTGAG